MHKKSHVVIIRMAFQYSLLLWGERDLLETLT